MNHTIKAVSIRQPWAWAIIFGSKPVENRCRHDGEIPDICLHRGPLLVHASSNCTRDEYDDAVEWMAEEGLARSPEDAAMDIGGGLPGVPYRKRLHMGGIVGRGRAVATLDPRGRFTNEAERAAGEAALGEPGRIWKVPGQYGLVLADVEAMSFLPCKGALGLWLPECQAMGCDDPARETRAGRRPAVATIYRDALPLEKDRTIGNGPWLFCPAHADEAGEDDLLLPARWKARA